MILIVGATGFVGGDVCNLLAGKGKGLRALVRSTSNPAKIEQLNNKKVDLIEGDLKDRASLDAACRGIDAVISSASATISRQPGDSLDSVDLQGQLNLIDAAYAAGVSHFIYISVSGNINIECPLRTAKRSVEEYLKGSGLKYTILRPTFFNEVWLGPHLGFDFVNAKVRIYGEGTNKISYISLRDVARYAVASLENPAAQNGLFELGGPHDLSPLEVVKIFEEQTGREFEVEHVAVEDLERRRSAATDPLELSITSLMLCASRGDQVDRKAAHTIFPDIRPSSVRDYAKAVTQSK
jgi:NADH dehydrogenase